MFSCPFSISVNTSSTVVALFWFKISTNVCCIYIWDFWVFSRSCFKSRGDDSLSFLLQSFPSPLSEEVSTKSREDFGVVLR